MCRIPIGSRDIMRNYRKHFQQMRDRLYDVEPFSRTVPRSFDDLEEDRRLRLILKRAVSRTEAPEYLVESIRNEIRK